MISISCTNCKALLTIDEAFAGGVCRCQHCGTIQTVPAGAGKGQGDGSMSGSAFSGQSLGGSKILSSKQVTSGTGLDDLADIVASSGLGGSGLTSRRLNRSATAAGGGQATATPAKPKMLPVAIGGAAVGALVVGLVLFFALRPAANSQGNTGDGGPAVGRSGGDNVATNTPAARGPSFAGVAIEGNNVAYVLDCGSGTREVFELLKQATVRSISSLGANRKFQILFWQNGENPPVVFPATGLTYATDKKIEEVRHFLDGVAAYGSTDATPALEKAYAQSPDAVVLATGKGTDLTEDFATGVTTALKGLKVPTYTFSLGEGGSDVLKKVADSTSGQYRQLTPTQLDAMVR